MTFGIFLALLTSFQAQAATLASLDCDNPKGDHLVLVRMSDEDGGLTKLVLEYTPYGQLTKRFAVQSAVSNGNDLVMSAVSRAGDQLELNATNITKPANSDLVFNSKLMVEKADKSRGGSLLSCKASIE